MNTSLISRLLRGNGITAIAVVLLSISVGAVALPGLFADTVQSNLTNVSARLKYDKQYTIALAWKGVTSDHWQGDYYKNGVKIGSWSTTETSKQFTGITCDGRYTFRIAAIGRDGGLETPYKGATITCLSDIK